MLCFSEYVTKPQYINKKVKKDIDQKMKKDINENNSKEIEKKINYERVNLHPDLAFNSFWEPKIRLSPNRQLAVVRSIFEEKRFSTEKYYLEVVDLLAPAIKVQWIWEFTRISPRQFEITRPYITPKYVAITVASDIAGQEISADRVNVFVFPAVPVRGSRRRVFSDDSHDEGELAVLPNSFTFSDDMIRDTEIIAIDDETNRMVVTSNATLYLYQMDLPAIDLKAQSTLFEGTFNRYGSVFVNSVLTITSGTTLQQFTLGEDTIDKIASFNLDQDERIYEIINADMDNDQFWVTARHFLLKISMKEKKLIERIAVGLHISELKMVGKFLLGRKSDFPPYLLIAFDTENGDLKSSFDENAVPLEFSSTMIMLLATWYQMEKLSWSASKTGRPVSSPMTSMCLLLRRLRISIPSST